MTGTGKNKYFQLIPEKVYQNLPAIDDTIGSMIKGYSADCLKEVISIVATHTRKDVVATQLQMTYIKELVPQGDKYLRCLIDRKSVV